MDNRDVLVGVLASALIGTLILWWQSYKPEPSGPQGSGRAPTEPLPQLPARAPTSPPMPARYDPSAARPTPSWYPDPMPEAGIPIGPDQVESFRFRPLGKRELERLERQAPYPASPWSPQDRTRTAPELGAQPMQPMEPWGAWRPGHGGSSAGPRDSGRDAQDFWQGPSPSPYQHIPHRDSSPPDESPPSQRMYPALDPPNDGPPADRPLIGRRSPGNGSGLRIARSARSASQTRGILAAPAAAALEPTAGRMEKKGRICDA